MSRGRDSEAQWPPRSPREALLSTPKGRERYQRMLDRTSPSPSPTKQSRATSAMSSLQHEPTLDDEINDDDDEETLQLKLQALQARIKLKRLQTAKAKDAGLDEARKRTEVLRAGTLSADGQRRQIRATTPPALVERRPISQNAIEVPVSPVRKAQTAELQTSPRRVQLGIDKGLKAKDVSLKRAPSLRRAPSAAGNSQGEGYLRRARTPFANTDEAQAPSRPLSFNERMSTVRNEEAARRETQQRIERVRTKTFGIGQEEMDHYKSKAVEIPEESEVAPTFTREEILSQADKASGGLKRSNTVAGIRSIPKDGSIPGSASGSNADSVSFDSFSSFHLSRRNLPHSILTRHLSGKQLYHIQNLLKVVKGPDFSLPTVERDIVVFGILAKKSEPRSHKPTTNGSVKQERGKYMVMTLVDLKFELELFLFNSGFTRFWKLTEGTVIAILNPTIIPPPPGRRDTGRFSLVVNSDEDTIIEIGLARDLGYCTSVKKDGDSCGTWINKKRTSFCEFHTNEAIRKTQASRVEMNGFSFGGIGGRRHNQIHLPGKDRENKKNQTGGTYDRATQAHWFMAKSASTADLIDGKDISTEDKKQREEHLKRSLAAKEKEVELMKKLGRIGNAAGREYMQRSGSRATGDIDPALPSFSKPMGTQEDSDGHKEAVKSLQLGNRDRTIHLSPIKRKRAESSQGGSIGSSSSHTKSSTVALGWGSGLKDKLARMKEGEKLRSDDERQPVRKKTRFVTEKGIREAGRESLGLDLPRRQVPPEDDDDDDELVFV